ncbi:MAG TPA: 50S ribosomal protein L11 methyltransferase [Xanthomonadales bacterium]|nr:50S ribosomal protein L11 methyltransferase [Xanthomonadales bacterium]
MAWLEVSVRTTKELAEQVSAAMELQEALAVTTQAAHADTTDTPCADKDIFEPAPGTTPLWAEVQVRGLFDDDISQTGLIEALMEAPGIDSADQLHWQRVEDQVWERAWMDRFEPMRFGKNLWIVPTGMPAPQTRGAKIIRLDPGVAFGTGAHATTALCLDWLDSARLKGKIVVDYGCGSGVLAIAAALNGAGRVIAVDNDPQALEACELNVRRNHVHGQIISCLPEHYDALLSDTLRGLEGVDVMIANILARPLIKLAPVLTDSLSAGGELVLSGLLDTQADSVRRAYLRAFGKLSSTRRDGWVRLNGKKKQNRNG